MKHSSTHTARLEARIPHDLHVLLRQVADLQGRTVSDFVVVAVREAAQQALEKANLLQLSAADQEQFAKALLSPPPQNDAMKRAFEHHASLVGRA